MNGSACLGSGTEAFVGMLGAIGATRGGGAMLGVAAVSFCLRASSMNARGTASHEKLKISPSCPESPIEALPLTLVESKLQVAFAGRARDSYSVHSAARVSAARELSGPLVGPAVGPDIRQRRGR